ncbi:helix-turn-helix transcriptional regulator [Glycocaulis profundi]|nr:helix-turn-helix transcriptional regulator [Glycocaulis profundi]
MPAPKEDSPLPASSDRHIEVGRRLRLLRLLRSMSQTEVANSAGLTLSEYRRVESGVSGASAIEIAHIAECLSVPVSALSEPERSRS